jgi:hypothetical protein
MSVSEIRIGDPSRENWDRGIELFGLVEFGREVNTCLQEGIRLEFAMRTAANRIQLRLLRNALVDEAKKFREDSDQFEPSGAYGMRAKPWYDLIASIDALIEFEASVKAKGDE